MHSIRILQNLQFVVELLWASCSIAGETVASNVVAFLADLNIIMLKLKIFSCPHSWKGNESH